MNTIINSIGTSLTHIGNNKNTSAAAMVYVLAKYGGKLIATWYPADAAQITQTAEILESIAVSFGLIMAGDAGAVLPAAPTAPLDVKANPTKGA